MYPSVLAAVSDQNALDTCRPNSPPSARALKEALTTFSKANDLKEAQVLLMTQAWMKQTKVVGDCRQHLKSVMLWFDEQRALE